MVKNSPSKLEGVPEGEGVCLAPKSHFATKISCLTRREAEYPPPESPPYRKKGKDAKKKTRSLAGRVSIRELSIRT